MTANLAALSALRTLEGTTTVPRDAYERSAVLGAFKALYRLADTPQPVTDSGNGYAPQSE